ncbi:hypothetical protein DERF_009032 [Dermatophagoides farinae]|uniref:Uncharacterized protein n=1 Tax=Dermatophagoides farinae TaxID=6954 RepID=A0A922HY96_DERFA|nr:hypothetical protein DERF_009032 [Dermatophagoides farinae]
MGKFPLIMVLLLLAVNINCQSIILKFKILNTIGSNSDLINNFWMQIKIEERIQTGIINTFQERCDDKLILNEKQMVSYITILGENSELDSGVTELEIYRKIRYQIISRIGKDMNQFENYFKNLIDKLIRIVKSNPWLYSEFMREIFRLNDTRDNVIESCYFSDDHVLYLRVVKRKNNSSSIPSKIISASKTSILNDDDVDYECIEDKPILGNNVEPIISTKHSEKVIISKINHPITSILTSTTTTSTTTPKPVLTTSKSIQTSSKPIQTSLKPIQSTSKPIQITTSKSIRTTSKPFRTTLSKSFRTTVKPKLGQPIFKFSTMNPKDIDITSTMKSIFKIKSNDHVNREKKNRICNGRKLFRTTGLKRGILNDQMDENSLNDENENNQIILFIKESNEINQQINQKILEEIELLTKKIEEISEKSKFNIMDFVQMIGTFITGLIISIQLIYLLKKLNSIKEEWKEYVLYRKLEMTNIEKNISTSLIKIDESTEVRNEENKIVTNPFVASKTYQIISFPFLSFLSVLSA